MFVFSENEQDRIEPKASVPIIWSMTEITNFNQFILPQLKLWKRDNVLSNLSVTIMLYTVYTKMLLQQIKPLNFLFAKLYII